MEYLIGIIAAILGILVGYLLRKNVGEGKINNAEEIARRTIEEAAREGDAKKKEMILEAREEIHKSRQEQEQENRKNRNEIQAFEKRVLNKEVEVDRKIQSLEDRERHINNKSKQLEVKEADLDQIHQKQIAELEKLSSLTAEEAKQLLLENIEKEIVHEQAVMIKEYEEETKAIADKEAREIISIAIQRYAADHVADTTITVINLPNDEMKGRIIGREGRNIRALETLTGIDLIIDDTPEAVVLSGFDPIRREVARIALERLIIDGRIHPARIEEMVNKAQKDVDNIIKEAGEEAAFELNIHNLHPELIKYLGRLKYRTSYGQNVLKHSLEVAHLAGMIAAELDGDVEVAKRGGLLHDLGKSIDHEMGGPHVELGVDLARKYGESEEVIHCIEAHHGDVEAQTVEALLVQAADAISAARPGARRETLELYIKRLENLEEIANSFDGVDESFAIQAGREIRILVDPSNTSESEITILARDIGKRIEQELDYPGQIKVNVIRETRAVDYAK